MNPHRTAAGFEFHEAPTLPARTRTSKGGRGELTILVVEDDPDARCVFTECLSHLGYRTATASDGELGVRAALRLRPAAILMDLAMPGVDGLEATRRIKASPSTRDCLVIVVTAHGPSMFDAARAAGCDAFFCKPFNPFAFDRVLRLLGRPPAAAPSARRDVIVKRCECSRRYTLDAWLALPLCGRMHVPRSEVVLELRNCACGSSIVLPV
jgi:CheY-like chemotaxis protein